MAPLDTLTPSDSLALITLYNFAVEIVNVFHIEARPSMRSKVVQRLELLLRLLRKITCLSPTPRNLVPVTGDLLPSRGDQVGRVTRSNSDGAAAVADSSTCDILDTTDKPTQPMEQTIIEQKEEITTEVTSMAALDKLTGYVRELDVKVLQILKYNNTKPEKDADGSGHDFSLSLPIVCLLLEDTLRKCKVKLKSNPFSKGGNPGLKGVTEEVLVREILDVLPEICQLMEDNQPASTPPSESSQPSTQDELDAMDPAKTRLFELVFAVLELVFSWPGFSSDTQEGWLEVLGGRSVGTQGPLSARRRRTLQYLLSFSDGCSSFSSQVSLVRCCSVIADGQHTRLGEICRKCLEGTWEGGPKHNDGVAMLVKCWLEHGAEMEEVVGELQTVIDKTGSNLPSLTRGTLPTVYRVVCEKLVVNLRKISTDKPDENTVTDLAECVNHFAVLISFIKQINNSRPMIRSALTLGQRFLDLFLSKGLPALSGLMKDQWLEVQSILKRLQTPTRYLHHVTGHSKSVRDIALTAKVPQMKKTLEHLVLKVKAMLAAHGCSAAFWLGNLKQRDLKGQEILSQEPQEEEEEEEDGAGSDISELSIDTDGGEDDPREDSDPCKSENIVVNFSFISSNF